MLRVNTLVDTSNINLANYTENEIKYIIAIYLRRKMRQKERTNRWKERQPKEEEVKEKPIKVESKYAKQYYHDNKDKLRQYRRQYYREHYAKNIPLDVVLRVAKDADKKKPVVEKTVYPKGDFTLHFV
jgi:hypothetical protein